ncbi:olfactory receptor 1019-like isoform X1 [Hemicordylus capensis]|uniref:olfactory receptor 1019-like isoform X1 n=2 Tax=Hemicordylus capensis TaxID=884348 RepID=UPI0023044B5A|nr:olfactory receptor 1019-like isoform X1 [Hemicordylus capensis]
MDHPQLQFPLFIFFLGIYLTTMSTPHLVSMVKKNHTSVTEFIFLGFTDHPELQIPLFLLFLLIYAVTLVGNLGMILLIQIDSRLHTPMYFFLSNLSLLDVAYSTVIAPRMLITFVTENKAILFNECAVQFFFFCVAVSCECCLLAAMAYDRFTAICSPLLYTVIMSRRLCILLVVTAYLCGFVNALVQTSLIFNLSFCGSNVIDHFFCDVLPVLKLSCTDAHMTHNVHFTLSSIIVISTVLTVLVSYLYILAAILRIKSTDGRRKTFSTCASHLTAVTIFFGTVAFMYIRPNYKFAVNEDKIISVFYTLVIPMLNPLIYSLRNKEVKDVMKRMIQRTFSS